MKTVKRELGKNGRLEIEGNDTEGYTVKEFIDDELYMETEFDDQDDAVAEAVHVIKKWADRDENE